jgi:hypothetical protein
MTAKTVIELIAELSAFPENAKVYLAIDEEGNDYKPVVEVEECRFWDYTDAKGFQGVIIWPGWNRHEIEPVFEDDDE